MKSLHAFILFFLVFYSCELGKGNKAQDKDKEYFAKVEAFLEKENSSLYLNNLYSDSVGRILIVTYSFQEAAGVYSDDVIRLQEFLVQNGISYDHIYAGNDLGKYTVFDKTTYREHQNCVETIRILTESIENWDESEIRKILDEEALSEDGLIELLDFIKPVSTTEIVQYQALFDDIFGIRVDEFIVCLKKDLVLKITVNYDNTKLIRSCDVVGNSCIIPEIKNEDPFAYLKIPA